MLRSQRPYASVERLSRGLSGSDLTEVSRIEFIDVLCINGLLDSTFGYFLVFCWLVLKNTLK